MTIRDTPHPLARQFLEKSKEFGYILALPLCREIARRSPLRCVTWAVELVEPEITKVTDRTEVADALAVVREGLANPSEDLLPRMDEAAWRVWACDFDYASAPFYAHRAASGLAWATMGAIIGTGKCKFESQFIGLKCMLRTPTIMALALLPGSANERWGSCFPSPQKDGGRWHKRLPLRMEKAE